MDIHRYTNGLIVIKNDDGSAVHFYPTPSGSQRVVRDEKGNPSPGIFSFYY